MRPQGERPSRLTKDQVNSLQQAVMDLKITNRAKDFFIEQLRKEREDFALERREYVAKLMSFNHRAGELETKLLQLQAPANQVVGSLEETLSENGAPRQDTAQ